MGFANYTILRPNNWSLHWPFWSDFFTEGVVFHDQLGNAKKAQTKMGAIYVSPRIVAAIKTFVSCDLSERVPASGNTEKQGHVSSATLGAEVPGHRQEQLT